MSRIKSFKEALKQDGLMRYRINVSLNIIDSYEF